MQSGLVKATCISAVLIHVFFLDANAQTIGCSLRGRAAAQSSCSQITKTFGDWYNDAGYNREISFLVSAFSVRPGFFACQETGSPNAFAAPDTFEPGTAGAVFLGIELARREVQRTGQYNNFTLPAILAHEVGHIVQFQNGNHLPTKLKELQADYLAGWYMGNRDQAGTRWSETSARQNMSEFYELGDYNYNDPDHHGTPDERLAALMAGFRSPNMPLARAYQASYRFVTSESGDADGAESDSGGNSVSGRDVEARVRACMKRRVDSCMADCMNNYPFGQASCRNQFCSPDYRTNQSWERVCRRQAGADAL